MRGGCDEVSLQEGHYSILEATVSESHERSCAWMSGPRDAAITVPAVKWWFAVSRDMFAKSFRLQHPATRTPAMCHRTPTFSSPLSKH